MMNLYRAIVEWLRERGYFDINPGIRRIVVQGFIGTMTLSAPFFWKITPHWAAAPFLMVIISVIKEIMDDKNSGLPAGEYMIEHSFKHLFQVWAGLLFVVFILIAVATDRGLL